MEEEQEREKAEVRGCLRDEGRKREENGEEGRRKRRRKSKQRDENKISNSSLGMCETRRDTTKAMSEFRSSPNETGPENRRQFG